MQPMHGKKPKLGRVMHLATKGLVANQKFLARLISLAQQVQALLRQAVLRYVVGL